MNTVNTIAKNSRINFLTKTLAAAGLAVSLCGAARAQAPAQPMNAAADPTCRLLNGYAFTYPREWSVNLDQASGFVKVTPNGSRDNEAYIVGKTAADGVRSAEDPRCAQVAEREMRALVPGLHRIGNAERFRTNVGPGVLVQMEGPNNAGVPIYTTILMAVHENDALFLIAIGPKELVHNRLRAVLTLFASIRAEVSLTPIIGGTSALAREWQQRLNGKKLTILSGYSSGSSGGFNGESNWWLNENGRYTYHSTNSVSIYVPGASGGSASENRGAGTWRVIEQNGSAILELRPEGGSIQTYRMERRNNQNFMNNRRVFILDK